LALRRTNTWRQRIVAGLIPLRPRKQKVRVVFICKAGARSKTYAKAFQSYLKQNGLARKYKVLYGGVETKPQILERADIVISPYFSFPETYTSPKLTHDIRQLSGKAIQIKVQMNMGGVENLNATFKDILSHHQH